MRAERRGDGYVLNGTKCLVTLAPIADVVLVFASTNPAAGKWGVSAFVVDASTPGVSASADAAEDGTAHGADRARLHFEAASFPKARGSDPKARA